MQLYLGNLAPEVDEPLLYELVSQIAPLASVRMPKHKVKQTHQGYGFAVFHSEADANYAREVLGSSPIKLFGRPLRVSAAQHGAQHNAQPSSQQPTTSTSHARNPGVAARRIFIGNLDPALADEESVRVPFTRFGAVVSVDVVRGSPDKSHAFVRMASDEAADRAIAALNGHYLLNRRVHVDLERLEN